MNNTITITTDDAEGTSHPATIRKNNKRKKTTLEDVKEIYVVAEQLWSRKCHINDAVDRLEEKLGMNRASAKIYLLVFQQMMKSSCYKRSINATATREFLKKISDDSGQEALEKAISAVKQHINYCSEIGKGRSKTLIAIVEEFS